MRDMLLPSSETPSSGAPEEDRSRLPLSVLIEQLAAAPGKDRISVARLIEWFEGRATLALLLVFGILNILPNPPGSSVVLGLPMLYLAAALMLGRPPRFPAVITRRGLSQSMFQTIARHSLPMLRRVERILHPRLDALASPLALRISGALCVLLSLILILPIPLGNIPPAACMCLLALAAVARDGLWTLIGWVASILCVTLMAGVTIASIHLIAQFALRLIS
ncbi:Uncharacterized conserved protein [Paracoccus laeviglucosivorans]|uniref:Uncharacterized conserved protein n=2 Tax=Paracoccus laeviglucosivorans TaxID=1197861 RepID=A0A521F3R9_9RHOB|nr:Uncharacterized conserved protein [Paracoccus laeviglucosivorans]